MREMTQPTPSLDELSALAARGDAPAREALFDQLRVRFLQIAKRRVRADDCEDVVQEALRIVHARLTDRSPERGILIWSLTVLRNVIGNYYQKKARLDRGEPFEERKHAAVATVGFPGREEVDAVVEALGRLARREPRCGALFRRILESLDEGGSPREISQRAMARFLEDEGDTSRGALYVALHRCRQRLRDILQQEER